MFGSPITAPHDAAIFHWIWVYSIKKHEDNRKKIRGVCDGSTSGGHVVVTGNTYAPTPQKIDFRLQIALTAISGLWLWHADVSNAFAEADRPEQQYIMRVDAVFREWWNDRHLDQPLPLNAVIPAKKNQGHPEGPRLWAVEAIAVLKSLDFKSTTHTPCLSYGYVNEELVIFLRMVDDFSIACKQRRTYEILCDKLDAHWCLPMTHYGRMTHFNGIDVTQTDTHVTTHVESYLNSVFNKYGWDNVIPKSLPMNTAHDFIRQLDAATPLPPPRT
jgi:hypothetical protein